MLNYFYEKYIFLVGMPPFFLLPLIGVILKIILHTNGKIDLQYMIDDDLAYKYRNKIEQWMKLNDCNKMWQVIQAAFVSNTKINAGASRNINRIPFKFTKKTPFYLSVNTEIMQMMMKKEKLIFLPDKILIIRGSKVGAIDYNSLSIKLSDIRFIENGLVPR